MHRSRRRWIRSSLWVGLAGAAMLLWFQYSRGVALVGPERALEAPEMLLVRADGKATSLAEYRGSVVLINLWAGYCPVCVREMPMLSRLHRELGPQGLVVLGVNVESAPAFTLAAAATRYGIDYPVVAPVQRLTGAFEGQGVLPQSWLIDRQGRIRASHAGAVSAASLERACRELLEEPAGSPPSPG